MGEPPRTHRVAVAAYVFHDDKMLLLRRAHSPQTFAPPGGRLTPEEDPIAGLHREIREETGLAVRVLGVAHVWYGSVDDVQPPLLCVNFVAESASADVRLSEEHTEFEWVTREQIKRGEVKMQTLAGYGYRLSGLLDGFDRYRMFRVLPKG